MNIETASIYSLKAVKRAKKKALRREKQEAILKKGRLYFDLPEATIQGVYQKVLNIIGGSGVKTAKAKYNAVGRFLKRKVNFYTSQAWRTLRYEALKLHGRKCQCCGRQPPDVVLHVDHIKPRSKYPELELDIKNVQVMCEDCNLGKGNSDEIDYR